MFCRSRTGVAKNSWHASSLYLVGDEIISPRCSMNTATCPEREDLVSFTLGKLPESEIESVADHLEACIVCDETVAALEQAADTFIEGLQAPPQPSAFADEAAFADAISALGALSREGTDRELEGEPQLVGRLGEYELLEQLGRGGMGFVYRALHTRLQRVVALKVLPAHRSAHEASLSRFTREIEAVAKLNHPNLVRAYDAGEQDGMNYLVMEMVEGVDLHRLVRQLGPLPIADACEIARQVAAGLQHVRDHGLVHRDIKPSNVLLSRDGDVKVLDLGLALWDRGTMSQEELTTTGQIMGTFDYMSPEQAKDSHSVDIRSDIYSLGCTLFKLLAGRPPFSGPVYETYIKKLLAHENMPAPFVRDLRPDVPQDVAVLIDAMLAKDPADRPQSPDQIVQRLATHAAEANLWALATRANCLPDHDDRVASAEEVRVMLNRPPVEKPQPVPTRGETHGRGRWWAGGLTGLMFAAVLIAGILTVVLRTPHGELIIESPEGDVEVEVSQGGEVVAIVDTAAERSIKLKVGEYGLRIVDEDQPFELELGRFTLRRDSKVLARVRLAPPEPDLPKDETPQQLSPVLEQVPQWSKVVSADTIREEIAALRWELPKHFSDSGKFQRGGYKVVRRRATELAMLFGIVAQYDQDDAFEWTRHQVAVACGGYATVARNKTGTGIRVHKLLEIIAEKATERLDDPRDLPPAKVVDHEPGGWEKICDRAPLMQRLDEIYQHELSPRLEDSREFAVAHEKVKHYAEVVAAIATVLHQPSMPEADDDDYRDFAKPLTEHARRLGQAAESGDYQRASHHLRMLSQTCSECHRAYR